MIKLLFSLSLLTALASCGTQPTSLSGFANQASRDFGLNTYDSLSLDDEKIQAEAAFIFSVLFNTYESNTHQMNGEIGNKVYVHDDGREAVFDSEGNLVAACENKGSFNYAHYKKEPLAHFAVDILPWLRWGNCREDTTTREQRILAYIADFENGFDIASSDNRGYFLPANFDFGQPGQSETIAFFLLAFDNSNFDLYSFIMNDQYSEEARLKFIQALTNGFKQNFNKT